MERIENSVLHVDPEDEIQCPYDKAHMIRHKRMQYHLQACRKQHPGHKLMPCPFDAKHCIPRVELQFHMTICPNKGQHITNVQYDEEDTPAGNIVPTIYYEEEEASEDWDSEISTNYFNLAAAGGINSYSKPREVSDLSTLRQPRNVSQVLQKSLPPGSAFPATTQSTSGCNVAATVNNRAANKADAPGAWGGAKGFGRGAMKGQQGSKPAEIPRPVGRGSLINPSGSLNPSSSMMNPMSGSMNPSSGSSLSASSHGNSSRRPVVRAATSTAAFSLSALTTEPLLASSAKGNGNTANVNSIVGSGWMKVDGNDNSVSGRGSGAFSGSGVGLNARSNGMESGRVDIGGNGIGRGRGSKVGEGVVVLSREDMFRPQPGYTGNSLRSQFASVAVSDEDEDNVISKDPAKQKRKLQKKLKQIERLEKDRDEGKQLDESQMLKLEAKESIMDQLNELG